LPTARPSGLPDSCNRLLQRRRIPVPAGLPTVGLGSVSQAGCATRSPQFQGLASSFGKLPVSRTTCSPAIWCRAALTDPR
jgi:hypothetical protein